MEACLKVAAAPRQRTLATVLSLLQLLLLLIAAAIALAAPPGIHSLVMGLLLLLRILLGLA